MATKITETEFFGTTEWDASEKGDGSMSGSTHEYLVEGTTQWNVTYKGFFRKFAYGEALESGASVLSADDAKRAMIAWIDG